MSYNSNSGGALNNDAYTRGDPQHDDERIQVFTAPDLSPLAAATRLRILTANFCRIRDPVGAEREALPQREPQGNRVIDITPRSGVHSVELNLGRNQELVSSQAFHSIGNLRSLRLSDTAVTDIARGRYLAWCG